MRNISINIDGVSIEIEDDGCNTPVPVYNFTLNGKGEIAEPELPGIVTDTANGLMWSREDVTPKGCKHAAAEKACKELRLGGFEDWRLPTRKELLTLVDDTRHDPAIDTERFPSCRSAWYWTSTPLASSSVYAWIVTFYDGYASLAPRDYSLGLARAVRSVAPGQ